MFRQIKNLGCHTSRVAETRRVMTPSSLRCWRSHGDVRAESIVGTQPLSEVANRVTETHRVLAPSFPLNFRGVAAHMGPPTVHTSNVSLRLLIDVSQHFLNT